MPPRIYANGLMRNTQMDRYLYGAIRTRIMRPMDTNTIGWRLDKAMRDARVDSQAQLSRISGVPQPTINRILKGQGKKGPESATLIALADALGVELVWLQQGRGSQRAGLHEVVTQSQAEPHGAKVPTVHVATEPKLQWITEQEAELLSEFRACEDQQKKTLLIAARGLPKAKTGIISDKA